MKCLVTGASGFLGRQVASRLRQEYQLVLQGHQHASEGMLAIDLRDSDQLRKMLDNVQPDIVVHGAAYRDPDFCEAYREEVRRLNVCPTEVFTEILPDEVPFLFISSDYVFDGLHPPYQEDDVRNPVNADGHSKMVSEDRVLQRARGIVLRVPLLIGAGLTWEGSGFIQKTVHVIQSKERVEIDDRGIRFPVWIDDVADVIAFLLKKSLPGVFHYSGLRGVTKYAWTKEIADRLGTSIEHVFPCYNESRTKAMRPLNTQPLTTKVQNLGYTPVYRLFRGRGTCSGYVFKDII